MCKTRTKECVLTNKNNVSLKPELCVLSKVENRHLISGISALLDEDQQANSRSICVYLPRWSLARDWFVRRGSSRWSANELICQLRPGYLRGEFLSFPLSIQGLLAYNSPEGATARGRWQSAPARLKGLPWGLSCHSLWNSWQAVP